MDEKAPPPRKFPQTYAEIIAAHRDRIRSTNTKIKIAIVGPVRAGKTRIANQLAGMPVNETYDATAGVRILEFDVDIKQEREELEVKVELWDLSGDSSYEACFQAVAHRLQGLCVVFDPSLEGSLAEVPTWCSWFSGAANLKADQLLVLAHSDNEKRHAAVSVDLKNGGAALSVPVLNCGLALPSDESSPAANPSWCLNRFRALVKAVHARGGQNLDDSMME